MTRETAWFRFRQRLARPVDAASLGVFRIVFGACVAWDVGARLFTGQIWRQYVAPPFHFHYAVGPVPVLPEAWLTSVFAIVAIAGACLAIGLFARVAAGLVFAGLTYEFLLDAALYLNHGYLMCVFALLLCCVPADRAYSVHRVVRGRRAGEEPLVPFGAVLLLHAQMLVVYFFAGVAKINGDWLRGAPLDAWLAGHGGFPVIGPFVSEPWLIVGLAWASLLFDLAIGPLLLFRRTRLVAVALAGVFHLCNHFWFDIGVFPFLAFAATLNFLRPDWPRRLRACVARATGFPAGTAGQMGGPPSAAPAVVSKPRAVIVVIWIAVQALVPLRHWLYAGDVNWTEEGHYFSWRMLLRDKGYELHSFAVVRGAPSPDAGTGAAAEPGPDSRRPEGESWQLQPVADPVPPLFALPLPLQSALSPAWSRAVEDSPLDRLVAGFLSDEDRRALGLDARTNGEPFHIDLDRVLTHRGLYMAIQHARRRAASGATSAAHTSPADMRNAFRESARELFAAVDLALPPAELDRLLEGERRLHRLRLTGYQAARMLVHPELLRQYARHVADELEGLWAGRPGVFVDVRVALNFRPFAPLVSAGVDLGSQPFSWGHAGWIEPLDVPLPTFAQRRQRRELLEQQGYFTE